MHCSRRLIVQTLVFSRSYLHRQVSPPQTLVVKGGNTWARNGRWILPENARLPFQRKACWGFFRPEKSDGFGRVWTRELGYQRPARYLWTTEAALLKHYCNSNKVCAFVVGLHCDNWIIMHRMENVKLVLTASSGNGAWKLLLSYTLSLHVLLQGAFPPGSISKHVQLLSCYGWTINILTVYAQHSWKCVLLCHLRRPRRITHLYSDIYRK